MSTTHHRLPHRLFALAAFFASLLSAPVALAAGSPAPTTAPSPAYTLPIHAVMVTDGTYTAPITASEIQDWVDYANDVYDDAGVQFFFDENNPDLSNLTNANLSATLGDSDPFWAQVISDGNAEAAKHPGKVVVIFRYGPIDPDPAKIGPTGGGFSDDSYNFIVMPGFNTRPMCGHQNIMLFAHEAGHYLGLAHTFAFDNAHDYDAKNLFDSNGKNPAIFDGDGLADTEPDPFYRDPAIDCDASITSVNISGVNFTLPRTNIMSYYDNVNSLTQEQIAIVRQTIESNVHDLFPSDPAIKAKGSLSSPGSTTYASPDIWIDSSFNGYGVYADWQTLDSEGVPWGAGDPFWAGKLNYIRYRVRNIGPAAAANVKVRISLVQPLVVSLACGAPQPGVEKVIATQTIDLLESGATYLGKVPWVPTTSATGQVKVRILDTPFELSTSNNTAKETLGSAYFPPGSFTSAAASASASLAVFNPCGLFIPIHIIPVGLHPGWEVTLEPMDFLLGPGEAQSVKVRLTPPGNAAAGDFAEFNFHFTAPSGDASDLLGDITLTGLVAQPMSLMCTPPESPVSGRPLTVRGGLTPAQGGLPVWLEYVLPDGTLESHEAATDGGGAFADAFTPSMEGPWTVRAYFEGDLEHQPARSRTCAFRVGPPESAGPPAAEPAFLHQVSATTIYYRGGGCGPKQVEIRAMLEGPTSPYSIVAFYRLRDQNGGGTTAWIEGVAMSPAGDGWFELNLASEAIPGYVDFATSRLELQFVATGEGGQILARSPVTSDVIVEMCSR